jgi:hypothetical protein
MREQPNIIFSGYLERTSCIGCGIPAAGDHLISRLEAAPTGCFSMLTWTFRISALFFFK